MSRLAEVTRRMTPASAGTTAWWRLRRLRHGDDPRERGDDSATVRARDPVIG